MRERAFYRIGEPRREKKIAMVLSTSALAMAGTKGKPIEFEAVVLAGDGVSRLHVFTALVDQNRRMHMRSIENRPINRPISGNNGLG